MTDQSKQHDLTEEQRERVRQHQEAFEKERKVDYPQITEFERDCGYAIGEDWVADAAFTLQCPVKKNPPHWQHGRVLYAALRQYMAKAPATGVLDQVLVLDIGTAKGFSALCMAKALADHDMPGMVHSVDVVHPEDRVNRNSIADIPSPRTVPELLAPWSLFMSRLVLSKSTGIAYMQHRPTARWNFAFVDGKHNHDTVREELAHLSVRQRTGDIVVVDDVQIPGVRAAVHWSKSYRWEWLEPLPHRGYVIGTRKG